MDCHKGGIVTKSFHHAPHMNSEPGWNVFDKPNAEGKHCVICPLLRRENACRKRNFYFRETKKTLKSGLYLNKKYNITQGVGCIAFHLSGIRMQ